MKTGKLQHNIISRALFKQIKSRRDEVLLGPAFGEDNAALSIGEDCTLVLSTNPVMGTMEELGHYGVYMAVNNLVTGRSEPLGIMVNILVPDRTEEITIRNYIKQLEAACVSLNMDILGGHTQITEAVSQPVITITGVGQVKRDEFLKTGNVKPGQEIVMTKWAGLFGTYQIAELMEESLLKQYSKDFLAGAKKMDQYISVVEDARAVFGCEISAMHDLSNGGVYGGLWEVAAASKVGLEIDLTKIPMKQETVEICEYFDLNPCKLNSVGSLLIACDRGSDVVEVLHRASIEAVVIGRATEGKDRIIINEDERRFLEPPKSDELNKILQLIEK